VAQSKTPTVFVVSDGRGETAAGLLRAAAVQFEGVRYNTVRRSGVRTAARVVTIAREAARRKAAIFYTLVSDESRKAMSKATRELHVPSVDLLGPSFTALHDLFHRRRTAKPGLLYAQDHERIDRMEAIDYTLKHDDGQRSHELSSAHVVLVGVSRASKSTTCFYLAYEGIRAANVPLLHDTPAPPPLSKLPQDKVIGLRVQLDRLLIVRGARAGNLRLAQNDPYIDRRSVAQEITWANRLMDQHGWRSIDASYLAVEEIAREVLHLRSET
jgi:regulator of PEP synthase PpsR (kinase-PPPase family)